MKKSTIAAALALALAASPAAADHHGRGQEQLNGFPGIYDLGIGTGTFTGDGYFIASSASANVAIGVWRYEVRDGELLLLDISPPAFFNDEVKACVSANWATYTMVDVAGGFDLEAKDEPCPQRAGLFTRATFKDYVRPD